jgi:hypothetical protein
LILFTTSKAFLPLRKCFRSILELRFLLLNFKESKSKFKRNAKCTQLIGVCGIGQEGQLRTDRPKADCFETIKRKIVTVMMQKIALRFCDEIHKTFQ